MAFKLAEAFIEFKIQGLNSVAAQMSAATKQADGATSAVKTLDSAISYIGTGPGAGAFNAKMNALDARLKASVETEKELNAMSEQYDANLEADFIARRKRMAAELKKFEDQKRKAASVPGGQLASAGGPPLIPPTGPGGKAEAIEQRLRAAIATLNRLQTSKAGGAIVLDIDLAKARGAVGGLTASLARFTGKSVADINQQFGVTASQATSAKPPVDRLAKSVSSIKPPQAPSGGFFSAITSGASSAIGMMTSFKGMLAGAGIAAGAFSAVNMVGQAEQTSVAFEVMLGSASKAKQMLGDLRQFADVSPFTFPGVADASKTLLQFGVAARDVVPTIKRIGDVAAGDEQKMHSLSLAFGQMTATGRLMGQDLLQMVNAGFNPLQEISRTTGQSMASLKKRMEDGGISAQEVAKAFETATSQGGKFFGMTERMSGTTLGLLSTLKDNAMSAVRNMTEPFMPAVNTLIKGAGQVIAGIGSMLAPSFSMIGREISSFFESIDFKLDFASMGESLLAVSTKIVGTFKSIYAAVSPIVMSTVGFITATWQRLGPSVISIASSILDSIAPIISFIEPMLPTIAKFAAAFLGLNALVGVVLGVGAAIGAIASPVGIALSALAALSIEMAYGGERSQWLRDAINGAFSFIGEFIANTIDLIGFSFRNWGELLDLAVAHAGLFVDNTMARFDAFRQNVGTIATWIGDNWLNIFKDMASGTATILANIGANLGEFIVQVKNWLAGDGFDFQVIPLTQGFEASTKKLPKLISPAIKETTAEIEGLYRKIGESEAAYAARKQAAAAQVTPGQAGREDLGGAGPGMGGAQSSATEKGGRASFLGFDMLAKRMGADSPMVQEQKKTNSILSAREDVYKANATNETMQTIPSDWAEKAGNAQASKTEEVKGALQEQLVVFSQAVTALQSLVDMASNKGIKTQGGEAVFA